MNKRTSKAMKRACVGLAMRCDLGFAPPVCVGTQTPDAKVVSDGV